MKKAKVIIKNPGNPLSDKTLHTLGMLILYKKIKISDLPASVRLSSKSLYIYSFRVSRRASRDEYISNLTLLANDLDFLKGDRKYMFSDLLDTYLSLNSFRGDEQFELFRKKIQENLLF